MPEITDRKHYINLLFSMLIGLLFTKCLMYSIFLQVNKPTVLSTMLVLGSPQTPLDQIILAQCLVT